MCLLVICCVFDVGWGGALVAPIRLTTLPRLQHRHQRVPENCQVSPIPRGIRPTPPANISRQDAQPHLIMKTTLLELVAKKRLQVAHRDPEIGSVMKANSHFLHLLSSCFQI